MAWRYFRVERVGAVATVTLDRPPVNALDLETLAELDGILEWLEREAGLRATIFTAAPGKVFAAGADIRQMLGMTPEQGVAMNRRFQAVFLRLERLVHPTIAAVHGLVLGGGFELALSCDLRIAAENTQFSLPEPRLGLIPGGGGTQRLPRLIAPGKAKELAFADGRLTAEEALQCHLVQSVVPVGELLPAAMALAGRVARNAPVAVQAIKQAMDAGLDQPLQEGLRLELRAAERCFATGDFQEGVAAFLAKREPVFQGK